jgi:hypothetical protein
MTYNFEDLSVGQYQKLLQLGDDPKPIEVVEILTGKKRSELTVKETEEIQIGNITPPEAIAVDRFFFIDGVAYGRVDMETLSYGEFVDLLDYAKDMHKNLVDVVALMYRPITQFKGMASWKIKMANELIKRGAERRGLKVLESVDYEIELYDPVKCDLRHKQIKQLPASAAHWCVTFFLNFSQQLLNDSRKSLVHWMETAKEEIKEKIKMITSKEE